MPSRTAEAAAGRHEVARLIRCMKELAAAAKISE
jgi:hypothetical protein